MKSKPTTHRESVEQMWSLRKVDWWRAAHRLAVFCRELRGDAPATITAETQQELARAQKLRTSVEQFADRVVGGNRE